MSGYPLQNLALDLTTLNLAATQWPRIHKLLFPTETIIQVKRPTRCPSSTLTGQHGRPNNMKKINAWRDFLLRVVCHLRHCCVFLEDLITFMPEFRKLRRAHRTLCVLQACAFMSVSVWLTWPLLLEPEASGLCWEQMMMTDTIDSAVGRRTRRRRRATTSI